jgi:hypothetical protein
MTFALQLRYQHFVYCDVACSDQTAKYINNCIVDDLISYFFNPVISCSRLIISSFHIVRTRCQWTAQLSIIVHVLCAVLHVLCVVHCSLLTMDSMCCVLSCAVCCPLFIIDNGQHVHVLGADHNCSP